MKLIDIYIQEVTRRLPEKSREDIALELRSTIEDSLPDDYSEEDVKAVLEQLGSPAALANGYLDRPMHLIGPRYYDVYVSLLKMILPIASVISLISVIAEYFIGIKADETIMNVILNLFGIGIVGILEVGMQTFFLITIVFAVMERVDKGKDGQPLTTSLKKWTPDDLKNIPYIPIKKEISRWEVFWMLMWTAVWATVYFNADRLVGIYEQVGGELEFVVPAFHQDVLLQYWPIIIGLVGLEVAFAFYKLIQGRWTKNMAKLNALHQLLATIAVIAIMIHPSIFNREFLSYMADVFKITPEQFRSWLLGGVIVFFIAGAAYNAYEGFRKARAAYQNTKDIKMNI
ncbi:hypothetical protein D1B31_01220 [Neobacillus notoginsengisoli]|uniref:Uncharacterized protein n=1 Tax=Neobacillus notoginsengisoli TaxID=1578198 RepID=A0A417YZH4_9BACI|nr:hypothetical protein [Neobacillus notoginsengisoli]RHW43319.1 hypothetical protein D1B31_01220 [Neobacillus notoginsengisoli]